MLKLNTPVAVWKFFNWMLFAIPLAFIVLGAPLGESAQRVAASAWWKLLVLMIIAYFVVRGVVVSKGIPQSDLNSISKASFRAWAASFVVAIPLWWACGYGLGKFTELFGVYDTFSHGLNYITKFGVVLIWVALPLFIGWLLWGKRVYVNQIHKLGVSAHP